MDLLTQDFKCSDEPSTKGFDLSTTKNWIYPENYPVREYQFNIVKSALYHNTLVCLPTGLGKTFIAAVVMYNFSRWYPRGKIVFLAPTKPLVAQQINACYDIMGISKDEMVELTGATDQRKRRISWEKHRVIFATPQTFHKDLEKNIVPSELVKCVVVDEAHKALGKHSYCESIRILSEQNKYFRILGLSATPGGKLDAVQEVVRNLHITHLELRDDTSPDITPYINERKLDIILVGLGADLEDFKDRYITIMDPHVRVLIENNVLRGNTGNISKGRIFMIQKEYAQKGQRGPHHGQIMKTLTILMTMYHAYELMVRHGLRAFYNFYQNHMDKFWLKDEPQLKLLLEEIIYYLGPSPDVQPLPDGSVPEIPEDIRFGHNKFHKLRELLLRHFESFENKEENTRAIVFVEYRDIVNEVYVLLLQSRPLIRPQKFVGQAGQKQRQQKVALEDFRSNKVNVLISTSVGEEGLDVGEVDLIVCFDISHVSPIRLVQRMGRTGRKRDGHIVVLVTDGKEHQTLKAAMNRRDSLNNKVLQSSGIIEALDESSPRMVPTESNPECLMRGITVVPSAPKGKGKAKEPKKPRKRAGTKKTTKTSKASEPSTSKYKTATAAQPSLMTFLKRTTDDAELNFDDDIIEIPAKEPRPRITQSSQQFFKNNNMIKASNVKLLTSDDAALEFLTLCTIKRSENEQPNVEKPKKNPYLPSNYSKKEKIDVFFNFEIPELRILDCLKNITEYVPPLCENNNDEPMICEVYSINDDVPQICSSPQISQPVVQDSKFEALLDESTSDTDVTIFDPEEAQNTDFPTTEKVDWGVNEHNMRFEDLLDDEWSDESVTCFDQKDKTSVEITRKFEDILNSSSNDSDETYYSPKKNVEVAPVQTVNAENPNEISSDTGSKNSSRISWQSRELHQPFEMMLDEETVDLLKDSEWKEKPSVSTDEVDHRYFKMISGVKEASISTISNNPVQKEFEQKKQSQSIENQRECQSFKNIVGIQETSTKVLQRNSTLQDEKSQSLGNKFEHRPSDNDSQTREGFTNVIQKNSKDGDSKDKSQSATTELNRNNSTQDVTSMLTLSQTLHEIDRINSRPSTSNENPNDVKNDKIIEQIEADAESEEDMFGIDDLMMDSDFEEQIDKIEKSVDDDIESDECEILFVKDTPKKIVDTRVSLLAKPHAPELDLDSFDWDSGENGIKDVKSPVPTTSSACKKDINETSTPRNDRHSPVINKTIPDVDIDEFDWDSDVSRDCDSLPAIASCQKKNPVDNNWNEKIVKDPPPASEKVSVSEKSFSNTFWKDNVSKNTTLLSRKNFRNNDCEDKSVKNSPLPSVKSSIPEPILDDCDWSSDFEAFSPLKSSTSFTKVTNSTESPKSNVNSLNNNSKNSWPSVKISHVEETTGWISTDKPKLRLTLGKKLSRNINKNLSTKQTPKKLSPVKQDSDSENEFAVSRIETAAVREVESDYFAKPADPVDKKKKPESLGMYNPRGVVRDPLSLKRNDVNKVVGSLKDFSAPAKYTQQQRDTNNRSIGVGRQKSASVDLDTRKKKKHRRNDRRRLRVRSEFLDDEAEVSSDGDHTSGSSGVDDDLEGFVSYTQQHDDSVDMQAHYLQTVRSPRRAGGFYIRKPKSPDPNVEIYSQALPNEPNSYLYDSFCVPEDADDVFDDPESAGEITIDDLELSLKNKKRKRGYSHDNRTKRKRKVLAPASDVSSSEDETEKLRRQIQDESFILKNKR